MVLLRLLMEYTRNKSKRHILGKIMNIHKGQLMGSFVRAIMALPLCWAVFNADAVTAVAFGETTGKFGYAVNQPDKAAASRAAIEDCKKRGGGNDCKVFKVSNEIGYGALYAACVGSNCGFVSAMTGRRTRDAAHNETAQDCRTYYQVPSCVPLAEWQETSGDSNIVAANQNSINSQNSNGTQKQKTNKLKFSSVHGLPADFDDWILVTDDGLMYLNPYTKRSGKNLTVEIITMVKVKSDYFVKLTSDVDCEAEMMRAIFQVVTDEGVQSPPEKISADYAHWHNYPPFMKRVCNKNKTELNQRENEFAKAKSNRSRFGHIHGLPADLDDWIQLFDDDDLAMFLNPNIKQSGKYLVAETAALTKGKGDFFSKAIYEVDCEASKSRAILTVHTLEGHLDFNTDKKSDEWSSSSLVKPVCLKPNLRSQGGHSKSNRPWYQSIKGLPADFDTWLLIEEDDKHTLHVNTKTKRLGGHLEVETIVASPVDGLDIYAYTKETYEIDCYAKRSRRISSAFFVEGVEWPSEKKDPVKWQSGIGIGRYVCPESKFVLNQKISVAPSASSNISASQKNDRVF